jgi:hypothetical protein
MTTKPRPGVPVPPDDLLPQWITDVDMPDKDLIVAAAWGADQQLRLCVAWLDRKQSSPILAGLMYSAMRPEPPKPPTLKEQALAQLRDLHQAYFPRGLNADTDIIYKALETLP